MSALFWVNMMVGGVLTGLGALSAPAIAAFYHEPRLLPIALALSSCFLVNAVGLQHATILRRQMRFGVLAFSETIALALSVAVGISMALAGYGYWALVGMAMTVPFVGSGLAWLSVGWRPGRPRMGSGLRSMARFGGTITLNGLIVYLAYNLEKVLLGRFWGADALGLYGRAYQLVNIPTENLNGAAGDVAFSALSRVKDDPARFRNYVLTFYALSVTVTLPITVACVLFSEELVRVILGPGWMSAAAILRWLAPTILVYAVINPLGWLLWSLGLVGRSLKLGVVLSILVVCGYCAGLPYGVEGVAIGYSATMVLWAVPHIAWCVRGTMISLREVLSIVARQLVAAAVAGAVAWVVVTAFLLESSAPVRLVGGGVTMVVIYACLLFCVMGRDSLYVRAIADLMKVRSVRSVRASV
jgi:PST family polysaccharide transporter